MKVIGLAGGSGTGKGTVCSLFEKYNYTSIDADAVYHELISFAGSPCLDALRREFGDTIITSEGTLDRQALSKLVFAENARDKRERLNKITHSFVLAEIRTRISRLSSLGYTGVLVDAPLLFESGFDRECDIILCVISKKDTRIKRIIRRDGINEQMAEARISSQLSDEYLTKHADHVITNDGDMAELDAQIAKIVKLL